MQVDAQTGDITTYRFKMWADGTTEPAGWSAEFTAPGGTFEPLSGSMGLIAHESSVTYGTVTVTPL